MSVFERLHWDSNFFQMPVAKINSVELGMCELKNILLDLKRQDIKLVYCFLDPKNIDGLHAARSCKGILVDKKITYLWQVNRYEQYLTSTDWNVKEYVSTSSNVDLDRLAIAAGNLSRFKVDPQISSEKFEELYRIWMRESVNHQIADAVFVIEEADKYQGFVTVCKKNNRSNIGLVAVDSAARGKNMGLALVRTAQKWAVDNGFSQAEVITQVDNFAACRLYEKCGYEVEKIEYVYHFWL